MSIPRPTKNLFRSFLNTLRPLPQIVCLDSSFLRHSGERFSLSGVPHMVDSFFFSTLYRPRLLSHELSFYRLRSVTLFDLACPRKVRPTLSDDNLVHVFFSAQLVTPFSLRELFAFLPFHVFRALSMIFFFSPSLRVEILFFVFFRCFSGQLHLFFPLSRSTRFLYPTYSYPAFHSGTLGSLFFSRYFPTEAVFFSPCLSLVRCPSSPSLEASSSSAPTLRLRLSFSDS